MWPETVSFTTVPDFTEYNVMFYQFRHDYNQLMPIINDERIIKPRLQGRK